MTSKDIRDIAAYWGAPVTGRVVVDMKRTGGGIPTRVNAHYLDGLAAFGNEDARLHLRQIQSLTDEELAECARIDAGGEFQHGGVTGINRYSDELEVIYGNGASVHLSIPHVYYADQLAGQVAETIAYLQSIGVYVPGTIDEKYVELAK